MSKINLQSGILTVENRRSREKKRICSEVSVNSPGNPWSYDGIMQFGTLYDVGVCLGPTMPASGYSNGGAV